ncbi:MAG: helix-turn-helix domain-containing protein [candidate division NC10 bacterium]|nr:helix-turn-helix domain-containing protein [candidate division NC10 bacterium]
MTPAALRRIRRDLGLTQEQLAKELGVDRVSVARWETAARPISEPVARLVRRIAAEARGKAKRKGERPSRGSRDS